jgi:hypothetical protein
MAHARSSIAYHIQVRISAQSTTTETINGGRGGSKTLDDLEVRGIVGIIFGGVGAICLVVGLVYLGLWLRNRNRNLESRSSESVVAETGSYSQRWLQTLCMNQIFERPGQIWTQ